MDDYKSIERKHYNARHKNYSPVTLKRGHADKVNENAENYFYSLIDSIQAKLGKGTMLDYGCGTGDKLGVSNKPEWDIIGIDISDKSIDEARRIYSDYKNVSFEVMDCEKTSYPDNSFDIIFDYGTFSSISISTAIDEIIRILKPDGALVCIETLGHNPIFNLKRKISAYRGKRTQWASSHIMQTKNWEDIRRQFISAEIRHFNILSIFYAPFMRFFPPKISLYILNTFWSVDDNLINNSILSKYAFKTVACFRGLNK